MRFTTLVAYFIFIKLLSLSLITNTINCFRLHKEGLRPKPKCMNNITLTPEQQNIGYNPRCIILSNPVCLDLDLPYDSIYLPDNLPDLNISSFKDVKNSLQRLEGFRNLPKCWPLLQVALCSLFMPQCDENLSSEQILRIHRPNVDICNDLVNKPECRFIINELTDKTSIFNCSDTNLFARNCTNELRGLRSSMQPTCIYPLVPTSDESNWFRDVHGCTLHCKSHADLKEQETIDLFIKTFGSMALFFVITSLTLYWNNQVRNRKDKVMIHCNLCQLFHLVGWLLQFAWNDNIACNQDGSSLHNQPLVASPCALTFLLTYVSSLASLFWCSYHGKLIFEQLSEKSKNDQIQSKPDLDFALSLINYGIPLTLAICVAGQIDGNGLYGICIVGQQSIWIKFTFDFLPLILVTIYGVYYFIRIILINSLSDNKEAMSPGTTIRVSAQALLILVHTVIKISVYFYELKNRSHWHESIERYARCKINIPNEDLFDIMAESPSRQPGCVIDSKPIVTFYCLELLTCFLLAIVMATWMFEEKFIHGLKRAFLDMLLDDDEYVVRNQVDTDNDEQMGGFDLGDASTNDARGQLLPLNYRATSRLPSATPQMSRRSSLRSTTLDIPSMHGRHYNKLNEKTSRDVVEEMRTAHASDQLFEQPQIPPAMGMILHGMFQTYQQFFEMGNGSQSDQNMKLPNFMHGHCANDAPTSETGDKLSVDK